MYEIGQTASVLTVAADQLLHCINFQINTWRRNSRPH